MAAMRQMRPADRIDGLQIRPATSPRRAQIRQRFGGVLYRCACLAIAGGLSQAIIGPCYADAPAMGVHISVVVPPMDDGQTPPMATAPSPSTQPTTAPASAEKTAAAKAAATSAAGTQPHVGRPASLQPVAAAKTAPQPLPAASHQDGPVYPVSQIVLSYEYLRTELPPIQRLLRVPIILGLSSTGYVAGVAYKNGKLLPRKGFPTIRTTLGALDAADHRHSMHLSAINSIGAQLYLFMDHAGFPDVLVARSARQFRGVRDLRPASDTRVNLIIHDLIISEIRTVASGRGFSGKHPINNARNQFIIAHSPVHTGANAPGTNDIFSRRRIDDYLLRLNQQPGRQVSVGVSAGNEPDSMILDYDVHQAKPWLAYAQISNTGTPQTNPWIEDFGFIDNQLTNHDDILSLNYATAGFNRMQSVQGSYEFPILGLRRLRGRIFASYDQYTASNVGLGNLNFNGRASGGGGELIYNLAQFRRLFVYGIIGLQYLHESVNDVSLQQAGSGDFLLPYATLRLTRRDAVSNFGADATILGQWTPTQQSSLNTLGRVNTNPTWAIFQGDVHDSFYLEPLFEQSLYQAGDVIPANQIYLSVSGQEAFGQRLVPQQEDVLGGLYTVRGYPQSIVAGDNAVYGTVEYRLHVPHLFAVNPHQKTKIFGRRFNFAPPNRFTTPDWDLMLFTFFDAGAVQDSQAQSYEGSATLLSTGLGARITLYSNMEFMADWGVALHSVSPRATGQGGVTAGSSEFNFLFEISY